MVLFCLYGPSMCVCDNNGGFSSDTNSSNDDDSDNKFSNTCCVASAANAPLSAKNEVAPRERERKKNFVAARERTKVRFDFVCRKSRVRKQLSGLMFRKKLRAKLF